MWRLPWASVRHTVAKLVLDGGRPEVPTAERLPGHDTARFARCGLLAAYLQLMRQGCRAALCIAGRFRMPTATEHTCMKACEVRLNRGCPSVCRLLLQAVLGAEPLRPPQLCRGGAWPQVSECRQLLLDQQTTCIPLALACSDAY